MKQETVRKQTIASVRFAALAMVLFLCLSIKHRSDYLIAPLVFFVVLFVAESWMAVRLRHKAAQDAT